MRMRSQADDQQIVAGPMSRLLSADFGPPLHCLVIPGATQVTEEEALDLHRLAPAEQQG